jgi:transposase-like protein
MTEHLTADRYERTEERDGYRNGLAADRLLRECDRSRSGAPQTRDGSFSTDILASKSSLPT